MSRLSRFAAVLLGTMGFLCFGNAANADKSVCEVKVLNRSGCEVGDFDQGRSTPSTRIVEDHGTVRYDLHPVVDKFFAPRANVLFSSALHKHATNDLTGAIEDYKASLALDDSDPVVHWYYGTALQAVGRNEEARAQFALEEEMKKAIQTNTNKHGTLFRYNRNQWRDFSPSPKELQH